MELDNEAHHVAPRACFCLRRAAVVAMVDSWRWRWSINLVVDGISAGSTRFDALEIEGGNQEDE